MLEKPIKYFVPVCRRIHKIKSIKNKKTKEATTVLGQNVQGSKTSFFIKYKIWGK